jgi:hypothetical protein
MTRYSLSQNRKLSTVLRGWQFCSAFSQKRKEKESCIFLKPIATQNVKTIPNWFYYTKTYALVKTQITEMPYDVISRHIRVFVFMIVMLHLSDNVT